MPILAKTCRLLFRGDTNSDIYPVIISNIIKMSLRLIYYFLGREYEEKVVD